MRKLVTIASAVLVLAVLVALPAAADGGGKNVVLVSTTADGSSLARSAVQAVSVAGGTAEPENLARATATDCTGCRSTAVAVQTVFVTGDASTISPTNAAVAVNAGCTSCTSYAYAYQYVLSTDGPVYLSLTGRGHLNTIREEIADAAGSLTDPVQLTARLDELTAELKSVIDDELQDAGVQATARSYRGADAAPSG